MDDGIRHQRFPTTLWSVVDLAKHADEADYRAMMDRLVAGYWRPVYCFIRRKGYEASRAEDLTQEFFLRFFDKRWVGRADPQKGRFRTYLLTILVRFLADQAPKRSPKQHRFDDRMVSISALVREESRRDLDVSDSLSPERAFMRQWAKAVIENAASRLESWCCKRGRSHWYDIFRLTHFSPSGDTKLSQEEIANRLGMTRDQVRYGRTEASRKFGQLLREEVADQVGSSLEIEEEIGELLSLLEN